MSVIHTYLSTSELRQLTNKDIRYLRKKLADRSALNKLMNRPINQQVLNELRCILDRKPIPRQKAGQFIRGQMSRLSDGVKHPCTVRKMTAEERIKYGLEVS